MESSSSVLEHVNELKMEKQSDEREDRANDYMHLKRVQSRAKTFQSLQQRLRNNRIRMSISQKNEKNSEVKTEKYVGISRKRKSELIFKTVATDKCIKQRLSKIFERSSCECLLNNARLRKIDELEESIIECEKRMEPRTQMLLSAFEVFENKFEFILEKLNVTELMNKFEKLASSASKSNKNVVSKLFSIFKTNPSSYLVAKPSRGLYITCLMHSFDNIIVTADVLLPTVKVECDEVWDLENNFYWLMKVVSNWSHVNNFKLALKNELSISKKVEKNWNERKDILILRYAILNAISTLQDIIGTEDLGHLHYEMITEGSCTMFLLVNSDLQRSTKMSSKTSSVLSLTSQSSFSSSWLPVTSPSLSSSSLSWMPLRKVFSNEYVGRNIQGCNLLKFVTLRSSDILGSNLGTSEQKQLEQGMYIGYLKLACRVQGLDILVSKQHLSSLPCIKVDGDDGDDSDEDVKMVVKYTNVFDDGDGASMRDNNFKNMLQTKCHQLIDTIATETSTVAVEEEETIESTTPAAHRLHKLTFPVKRFLSMTLLAPPASLVCSPLQGHLPTPPPSCTYLPLRTFEMLHLNTYQPQIYRKYCQLSVILDLVTEVCRRRKILLEASGESESPDDKLAELLEVSHSVQGIQRDINEIWTKYRWLTDVIRQARLTSSKDFVSLGQLF
ncbi:hypothetical protein HELRODRAFT_171893 [Helobdella robusta]|uniref:Uncharacterized protein n=1 Tax=Helobdella robusta TaxID=6412 RepID=T1F4T2_HELRO|nr:hypothetical protein HELRODRAFT_171893 [Helobdella robusta]ESO04890.1 hypothetical protein HELRODRAFT_171893 [Helobdella robusta]